MPNLLILLTLLLAQAVHAQQAPAIPAAAGRLYQLVSLVYTAYAEDGDEVALYALNSSDYFPNSTPTPRDECAEQPKLGIGDTFDISRRHFNNAKRLWVDWDAGIIGLESEHGQYYFVRHICLPHELVDDLYLFGVGRKYPPPPPDKRSPDASVRIPDDSPGKHIQYDPKLFFERFEKYGVTPTFKVPDTKPREAWDSNAWNKTIFIFPLDGKNE